MTTTNESPTVASANALQVNKEKEKQLEAEGALAAEEQFQEYKASRPSVRLITTGGIRITFTNFRLLTQSAAAIAYLDEEIKSGGLPGITKGELLTMADVNPMQTLRREVEAQVRAELKQEAADAVEGKSKDMGSTEAAAKLNVATTKAVAR